MTTTELVEKIAEFEGYRGTAYLCPAGVLTIGFGRTEGVFKGETTTREKEEHWLSDEVNKRYNSVKKRMAEWNYKVTDNQLFALTDFVFNLGLGNLAKLTRNGSRPLSDIANAIPLYNKANGTIINGLVKRRNWEVELFNTPDSTAGACNLRGAHVAFKHPIYGWLEFLNEAITVNGQDMLHMKDGEGRYHSIPEKLICSGDLPVTVVGI